MIEQLPADELEVLEFARLHWKYAGAKETAIRDRFNMSATRYHQVLDAIIDKPAALLYDGVFVRQLRDRRDRLRSARRGGYKARAGR